MLSKLVTMLFMVLLVGGVPALSYLTARHGQLHRIPRLSLYLSVVLSQWVLAGTGLLVVLFTSRSLLAAVFHTVSLPTLFRWTGLLVAVSLLALGGGLVLERWGWWPPESKLVYLLIPDTPKEKLGAVLMLAPTAALCEEFLYRGYLLALLAQWFGSVAWGWGLSSVAFGLAHTYQGWSGMLRAVMLGALLGYPVVTLGSLHPSMLAHGLVDALALGWLGPRWLGRKQEL